MRNALGQVGGGGPWTLHTAPWYGATVTSSDGAGESETSTNTQARTQTHNGQAAWTAKVSQSKMCLYTTFEIGPWPCGTGSYTWKRTVIDGEIERHRGR